MIFAPLDYFHGGFRMPIGEPLLHNQTAPNHCSTNVYIAYASISRNFRQATTSASTASSPDTLDLPAHKDALRASRVRTSPALIEELLNLSRFFKLIESLNMFDSYQQMHTTRQCTGHTFFYPQRDSTRYTRAVENAVIMAFRWF